MRKLLVIAILFGGMVARRGVPWAREGGAVLVRPAFLAVALTANEYADPSDYARAAPDIVLHEFLMFPGWTTESQFNAVRDWLLSQGLSVKQEVGPQPWETYPVIKFSGTAEQIDRAFHAEVLEKRRGVGRCYTVFTNLLMPGRFAPKGAKYMEGFSIGSDGFPSLNPRCGWRR